MSKPIRILVADKNADFSRKLCGVLDDVIDIKIVGVVRDGPGAVSGCRMTLPDLVIMDLHLPVLDSIKVIQAIVAENERINILVTSTVINDRYAVEAIKAGASGYIELNGEVNHTAIIDAIRQVAQGELLLNSVLAASILDEFHRLTE